MELSTLVAGDEQARGKGGCEEEVDRFEGFAALALAAEALAGGATVGGGYWAPRFGQRMFGQDADIDTDTDSDTPPAIAHVVTPLTYNDHAIGIHVSISRLAAFIRLVGFRA
ncbi:hypothetical protein HK100_012629 [Physocladia obscura]|uniref:Uncharacterized protein n=1 Tax=Physocladia obscura TaxID=109957 RepID=A0AAD5T008_9FUNG|nr:hypothetical protein HK100_012629 [Physocladia obscura]